MTCTSIACTRSVSRSRGGLRGRGDARQRGGRVVAVGTTVVRTLESAAQGGELRAVRGETQLFLKPGYQFSVVDALLTNFHLPESTLLMLVCAFGGYDVVMRAYRHAVRERYRFFSYGDAMFLERAAGTSYAAEDVIGNLLKFRCYPSTGARGAVA